MILKTRVIYNVCRFKLDWIGIEQDDELVLRVFALGGIPIYNIQSNGTSDIERVGNIRVSP